MKKRLFAVCVLAGLLATVPLCGFDVSPEGGWSLDGLSAGWRIVTPGWTRFLNSRTCEFKKAAPGAGILTEKGKSMEFRSSLTKEGDSMRFLCSLTSADFPEFGYLDYELRVPFHKFRRLAVDGKWQDIPRELQKTDLGYFPKKAHTLEIDMESGTLLVKGSFSLMIQDQRKWSNALSLQLNGGRRKPSGTYDLELTLKFRPGKSRKIPLEPVVNMGFRDERAGDGVGGWTDQGAGNDMRFLSPGKLSFSGVEFELIDPAKNRGKSCLVLSSAQKKFLPSASVRMDSDGQLPYLYLLHAAAWVPPAGTKIGSVKVRYRDGRTEEFPVVSGVDCGNWWIRESFSNAGIACESNNLEARVGLYASAFRLNGAAAEITFQPEGNAVWIICAASFSDHAAEFRKTESREVISAGAEWLPVTFSGITEPGSPLDFSASLDAPAGKYGRVIADGEGHFVFERKPEKRIRFLGVNLCQTANYFSRAEAEKFTEQIARAGYNSVRFHHFENLLMDKSKRDPSVFDPEKLDSLQYLMACLKRRGIYYTLDLYASRELFPGCSGNKAKLLFHIGSAALDDWKRFVKRLLTVKNPYTGLSLAEDPALYVVNLVNEDNLSFQLPKTADRELAGRFESLRRQVPGSPAEGSGGWHSFLNGLERERIRRQTGFLRREIGTGTLITDLNFILEYALCGIRSELQVVDNHAYWDHMRLMVPGKWSPPQGYSQLSAVGQSASHVRMAMPVRVFGRPYILTEVNYCFPNRYRTEYGPMFGAYAGLQDWDGIYRFAWSHAKETLASGAIGGFDIAKDPSAQLADRLIHALFVRGDVSPAPGRFAIKFKEEKLPELSAEGYAAAQSSFREFSFFGLFSRIGVLPEGCNSGNVRTSDLSTPSWREVLQPEERKLLTSAQNRLPVTSETREITLLPQRNTLLVVTPRTEALAGTGSFKGRVLEVKDAAVPQMAALISLDGKELPESRKLLMLHLADMANSGQTFRNGRRMVLESYGKAPLLLQRCKINVALRLPRKMKVETLDFSGRRTGSVVCSYAGGILRFQADTALRSHGVMAYLISYQ